jgi:hypothetical protein
VSGTKPGDAGEQFELITGDARRPVVAPAAPVVAPEPWKVKPAPAPVIGPADPALEALLDETATTLNGALGDEAVTRRALTTYFRHGETAGFDHGFLVDMLGVSGGCVLDRTSLSERRKRYVMTVLATLG